MSGIVDRTFAVDIAILPAVERVVAVVARHEDGTSRHDQLRWIDRPLMDHEVATVHRQQHRFRTAN